MNLARRAPEGAAESNGLRAFRRAKVSGKLFWDFATMFREMWGCGLCVRLFFWPRWSKGGAKTTPKVYFYEYCSANSGPVGVHGAPENQQQHEKAKKKTPTQRTKYF